jgi:alpha-beta hydrolase superfamily lysophospholipase
MNPDLPLFYIGHGAGALIALTMLREVKQFKVAGVIVGNPSLKKP